VITFGSYHNMESRIGFQPVDFDDKLEAYPTGLFVIFCGSKFGR